MTKDRLSHSPNLKQKMQTWKAPNKSTPKPMTSALSMTSPTMTWASSHKSMTHLETSKNKQKFKNTTTMMASATLMNSKMKASTTSETNPKLINKKALATMESSPKRSRRMILATSENSLERNKRMKASVTLTTNPLTQLKVSNQMKVRHT